MEANTSAYRRFYFFTLLSASVSSFGFVHTQDVGKTIRIHMSNPFESRPSKTQTVFNHSFPSIGLLADTLTALIEALNARPKSSKELINVTTNLNEIKTTIEHTCPHWKTGGVKSQMHFCPTGDESEPREWIVIRKGKLDRREKTVKMKVRPSLQNLLNQCAIPVLPFSEYPVIPPTTVGGIIVDPKKKVQGRWVDCSIYLVRFTGYDPSCEFVYFDECIELVRIVSEGHLRLYTEGSNAPSAVIPVSATEGQKSGRPQATKIEPELKFRKDPWKDGEEIQ
ncbi:hypothetical protein ACKFKF_33455 [Phormidesmis sp. 146-12]